MWDEDWDKFDDEGWRLLHLGGAWYEGSGNRDEKQRVTTYLPSTPNLEYAFSMNSCIIDDMPILFYRIFL